MEERIRLRQLTSVDWELLKNIRLEALASHPELFCPSSDERQRNEEDWKNFLRQDALGVFGLFDSKQIIGLTGITRDRDDPSGRTALLVMSYIKQHYRGRGLSRLFYKARIKWAKDSGQFNRLLVGHREGNKASEKANQAFGFSLVSSEERSWPDGTVAPFMLYELTS
jgi:RimJ/RimL family protein N-acetyltransferase